MTVNALHSDAKGTFDAARGGFQGSPGYQDVSGVGDAAFLAISSGTQAVMYVLKGSNLMLSIIDTQAQNVTPAALTALGKAAIGRL